MSDLTGYNRQRELTKGQPMSSPQWSLWTKKTWFFKVFRLFNSQMTTNFRRNMKRCNANWIVEARTEYGTYCKKTPFEKFFRRCLFALQRLFLSCHIKLKERAWKFGIREGKGGERGGLSGTAKKARRPAQPGIKRTGTASFREKETGPASRFVTGYGRSPSQTRKVEAFPLPLCNTSVVLSSISPYSWIFALFVSLTVSQSAEFSMILHRL